MQNKNNIILMMREAIKQKQSSKTKLEQNIKQPNTLCEKSSIFTENLSL